MSNSVILIGLLAIAYVFYASGMEFLALLMAVLAVIMLLAGSGSGSGNGPSNVSITEPFGPQGPIVVENKLPDIPARINFKVKPNWHEYQGFEYAMFNFAFALNNIGHFIYRLVTGKKVKPKEGGGH